MKDQSGVDTNGYYAYILKQYMLFAPDEILVKFNNGYRFGEQEWIDENDECTFLGLKFERNEVYAIGIYIWQKNNEWTPRYLCISEQFEELLKTYNIYHVCFLIHKALATWRKESNLVEDNIIQYLINDKPYHLPKFRYPITKHHRKERRFSENYFDEHRGIWDKSLNSAIHKVCTNFPFLRQQQYERFSSIYFGYIPEPIQNFPKNGVQPSTDIQPREKKPRKPRREFGAFAPESWRRNRNNS